jgi:hypothetical protein
MEARKFEIGDRVRLRLNDALPEIFTISRVLPETAKVWQYRVKRVGDGQERAVSEPQLARATPETSSGEPAPQTADTPKIRQSRPRVTIKPGDQGTH